MTSKILNYVMVIVWHNDKTVTSKDFRLPGNAKRYVATLNLLDISKVDIRTIWVEQGSPLEKRPASSFSDAEYAPKPRKVSKND